MSHATFASVVSRVGRSWKPPPKLSLSEWADTYFYLSAESAAAPGRWKTLPYQREIMDAFTDPQVTFVSVMKSARVGWTKIVGALIGYSIHQDPCPILVVQPTVDDAKGYSKEEIAPMMRDVPVLSKIVLEDAEDNGPRDGGNTILHKALALNTPIATPTGWTTVAGLKAGDFVFDEAGTPTRVLEVTPVFTGRPCFKVRFSDGAEIVSDAEHGWAVEWWQVDKSSGLARQSLRSGVLSTEQIAQRVKTGPRHKYAVRNSEPLSLPSAVLPLDPYVLGAWLGDGVSHRAWITSGHRDAVEMAALLSACGHEVKVRETGRTKTLQLDSTPAVRGAKGRMQRATKGAIAALRTLGLLGEIGCSRKHIPPQYLRASVVQRTALLQGLMDTDGSIRERDGLCVLTTSARALVSGYEDLLSGLGIKWRRVEVDPIYDHKGEKHVSPNKAFRFEFTPNFPVFRLTRKLARQRPNNLRSQRRRIVAVEPVESVPVKCITVESAGHLFLAGRQMIPTHNSFPGGVLSLVGANSGAGLRRVSRKRVLFDEVDAYPISAGSEGDPVRLGTRRAEYYWDRKIGHGSTPLISGHSRIEELYEQGDGRRFYVPCPQCGHMDYFVFTERNSGGHFMQWPEGAPEEAHFVCSKNGCVIEHRSKREMVDKGEWRAQRPFTGHASFHIWAAYSYSPNATWGQLAKEFLEAKRGGHEQLKTFVNTVLGETWKETGEAPEWERLYHRREQYQIGTVPEPVKFLTAGVDVQKDRFVYEVVAWAANKESWSVEAGVLPGDTAREESWLVLDELLGRQYSTPTGAMGIRMLGIDSGYNTQQVYNWGRRHERNRVIAVKGVDHAMTMISNPTKVDVHHSGRRIARGYSVWPVGVSITKSELYGFLRLNIPEGNQPYPAGFCHFPEYDQEYFKQLTSEQLVTTKNAKTGRQVLEWHVIPGRENHWLDARVYARAVAAIVGVDRMAAPTAPPAPVSAIAAPAHQTTTRAMSDSVSLTKHKKQGNGWISRKNWFRK